MFVKICGMTNESDALFAVAMGADAVGFVFAPSSRQVSPMVVRDIVRRIPPEISTIGVFRDEATQRIVDIVNTAGLSGIQLHGHEAPAECRWLRERVPLLIKAFPIGDHLLERVDEYDAADAILIDSPSPGSGQTFDWSLIDLLPRNRRLILAGGLTPENVEDAILRTAPWGVDVVSGVEASPGHKDPRRVHRFCRAAKRHDAPVFEGDHILLPLDFDLDQYGDGIDVTAHDHTGFTLGIPSPVATGAPDIGDAPYDDSDPGNDAWIDASSASVSPFGVGGASESTR